MFLVAAVLLTADPAYASFESSLIGIKTKLTNVILPLLSVIGLGIAAISFLTGSPNAKQHITYAILGAILVSERRQSSTSFHKRFVKFAGLRRIGPTRASTLSTIEPVVTVALAALVLDERIASIQLGGGALILVAAVLLARDPA